MHKWVDCVLGDDTGEDEDLRKLGYLFRIPSCYLPQSAIELLTIWPKDMRSLLYSSLCVFMYV